MVVELVVDRVVAGGAGLAQLDGLKVFVPFSAPKDRVRARLTVRKKDYAVAEVVEVLEPSPIRTAPQCPLYGDCGGCQLQHISYDGQLVVKKLIVNDSLQRLGRVFTPVRNITGETRPWRYRNKTQYPVAGGRRPSIGFFRRQTHDLVDVPECLLHPESFDKVRALMLELMLQTGETAYNEKNHSGNVRHLVLRAPDADADSGMVATVVTRTRHLAGPIAEGLAAHPSVAGVVHNINPNQTNRIMGAESQSLSGEANLRFRVLGKDLRCSAGSFFQVNTGQAEALCRKVLKHAAPEGTENVLDLYSGVGMISLVLADFVRSVTGVEQYRPAVRDAEFNAAVNSNQNTRFVRADVDSVADSLGDFDIVVLDPPRKGCSPETLRAIAGLRPGRIIYVSCNPATLARDLKVLGAMGFQASLIEPVDMFPQTAHVEVVARIEPAA
ncbi:MAG: 23S rRNA (uracil(1939)-C(5))-methyltransferase RlmD [candidate division WOR-3 bacterium]|nr:MAG: 23S rRNA (uracil(1939)-C(5))-methyltransferase RlmD [candidate division WOR-3 bacterium]